MSNIDKYKVNAPEKPKKRTPLHAQKPLMVKPREGFYRYIMNDLNGNRERFEAAGYTAVIDKGDNDCDHNINKSASVGSELKLNVNADPAAKCHTATVMEIPIEWHEEDQAIRLKEEEKRLQSVDPGKHSVNGSTYGSFKRDRDNEERE